MPPINFGLNIWGPNNPTTTAPVIKELETFNLFLILFKLIKGDSFSIKVGSIESELRSLTNLNSLSMPPLKSSVKRVISLLFISSYC